MAHGTVQHSPRVAAGLNAFEGRARRAHRLYLEHSQGCVDCGHGAARCTVATGLWVVFTEARDGER